MSAKVKKRSDDFYDGYFNPLYSNSYMNAMAIPTVCSNINLENINNINGNNISLPIKPLETNNNPEIKFAKGRNKRFFYIIIIILICLVICVAVTILVIFAIVPCLMVKCNSKASTCINHPFYAQCICDYGYQGDGKDYCDECGLSYVKPNIMRVVGGAIAKDYSWPSAALIIIKYKTDVILDGEYLQVSASFMCSGTLINRKTIITAAHCIVESFEYEHNSKTFEIVVESNKYYPTRESMFQVYLGVENRSSINSKEIWPIQMYSVKKIIVHPSYDDMNIINDIALLQLDQSVELNSRVQISCLPNAKWNRISFPISDSNAFIIGWGTTQESGNVSNSLKNAQIKIFLSSYCDNTIPDSKKDWQRQICAGTLNGTADTCQGDSGGGLFVTDNSLNRTIYVVAGIVSYGDGCARKLLPGIYTRTSYFIDWINENSVF